MVEQIIFLIFTLMTIGGGIGVVSTQNLYYAALYLVLTFSGMAGYFVLLNAGFLAAVQIVVYVGAIAILILFAIMLSRAIMTTHEPQANRQSGITFVVALLLFLSLLYMIANVNWPVSTAALPADPVLEIGKALLNDYVIPFEVVSIVLVIALVGAIILARDVNTESSTE